MTLDKLLAMTDGFKTLSINHRGDEIYHGLRDDFEAGDYDEIRSKEIVYISMIPTEEDTSDVELIVTLDPEKPRADITDIVNKLSKESGSLDFPLKECWDLIRNYCKENYRKPFSNEYAMKNGCLFINGKLIKRLLPLPSVKGAFPSENEPDYEAMILSCQEAEIGGN